MEKLCDARHFPNLGDKSVHDYFSLNLGDKSVHDYFSLYFLTLAVPALCPVESREQMFKISCGLDDIW